MNFLNDFLSNSNATGELQIAEWNDTPAGREAFKRQIFRFKRALPKGYPDCNDLQIQQHISNNVAREKNDRREIAILLVVIALVPLLVFLGILSTVLEVVILLGLIWFAAELIRFLILCGSTTSRLRAVAAFGAGFLLAKMLYDANVGT